MEVYPVHVAVLQAEAVLLDFNPRPDHLNGNHLDVKASKAEANTETMTTFAHLLEEKVTVGWNSLARSLVKVDVEGLEEALGGGCWNLRFNEFAQHRDCLRDLISQSRIEVDGSAHILINFLRIVGNSLDKVWHHCISNVLFRSFTVAIEVFNFKFLDALTAINKGIR